MYQRKYLTTLVSIQNFRCDISLTWLVQTLLKVTNANVCASMVFGRSFFASASGMNTALRISCGTNARRSSSKDDVAGSKLVGFGEEFR